MKLDEIKVSEEYKKLVPRPTKKQYQQLKEDIKNNGVEEPIVINMKCIILDGYTRYQIAQELGINELQVMGKTFDNVEQEKAYVLRKGLVRRHLNATQRAMIAENLEEVYKAIAKIKLKSQSQKGKKGFQKPNDSSHRDKTLNSRERAVKEAGSSARALSNIKKIESTIEELTEPELKADAQQALDDAERGKTSLACAVKKVEQIGSEMKQVEPPKPPKCSCGKEGTRRIIVMCSDCFKKYSKGSE